MNRIKVLLFVDRMRHGGIQQFLVENIKHMDKTKVAIDVLTLDDGETYPLEEKVVEAGANFYKLKGVWGGIVGAIGIALPSIIAILIIAMFFQHFKDNYWVAKFFAGVRPAVVALIAAPCFKMAKTANINKYNFWIPIVCCALIALPVFAVSPIYVIIAAGVLGWLYGRIITQDK